MKRKKRKVFKFLVFLMIFIVIFLSVYFSSDKIVVGYAEKKFNSLISSASYHAIDFLVSEKYKYGDLVEVKTDNSGNVSMVITDSLEVNRLATTAANNAYDFLSEEIKSGVEVPVGAFTGIRLLSGFGKKVRMKIISVASVKCEFVSDFSEAGINQTRHSLYINIHCIVNIVTKTKKVTAQDKITVLIFDNLIVGKVPQVMITPMTIGKGEAEI